MPIRMVFRYFAVFGLLVTVTLVGGGSRAEATFQGGNGSIVYVVHGAGGGSIFAGDLWMADPGGSNPRKVYDSIGIFETWGPAFSPGGGTIAYGLSNTFAQHTSFVNVFDVAGALNAPCGGSDPDPLCNHHTIARFPTIPGGDPLMPAYRENGPTWSPAGTHLAVAAPDGIWVINYIQARECSTSACEEAARTRILANTAGVFYDQPNWQPGGSLIAVRVREDGVGDYSIRFDIGTVESTGGEVTPLYVWRDDLNTIKDNGCRAANPNWSPDGTQIAFETGQCFRPISRIGDWGPPFRPFTYTTIPGNGIAVVTPGGSWHRLTALSEICECQTDPVWAPDKSRVLYYGHCQRAGFPVTGICAVSLDGSEREYWGTLGRFADWSTGEGSLPDAAFDAKRAGSQGLSGVHRGDTIEFNGEGWEPGGPPIVIKWAGREVARVTPGTAAFASSFVAPDFPGFDSEDASLGQTSCRADITATQGGIHRVLHASGEPSEVVHKATNIFRAGGDAVSFGQSISCSGELFVIDDDLPLTLGPVGSNICEDPDIQSQFTLITSSIRGRAKESAQDQVEPYPGLWVQFVGQGGNCIDANGIHADQVWIGRTLVATGQALGSSPDFITEIDLGSGGYIRRQPVGGVSVNARIVRFLLPDPPPNDLNQNGIDDEVEAEVQGWNRLFTDLKISGSTHGNIVKEGAVAFTVLRDPSTGSLDIAAEGSPYDVQTGEENAAELEVCGMQVRMNPGDRAMFKCDSLASTVEGGTIEVVMGVNTGAVLPMGSDTTIAQQAGDDFSVANNAGSQVDVLLFAEGALSTVTPGNSDEATVLALKGDVNCGGTVDILDGIDLLGILAGLSIETSPCPASALNQRDIDCVGGVVTKDVLLLVQFLAGIAPSLGAGCDPIGEFPPAP